MATIVVIFASLIGLVVAAVTLIAGYGWFYALVALYLSAFVACLALLLLRGQEGASRHQNSKNLQCNTSKKPELKTPPKLILMYSDGAVASTKAETSSRREQS